MRLIIQWNFQFLPLTCRRRKCRSCSKTAARFYPDCTQSTRLCERIASLVNMTFSVTFGHNSMLQQCPSLRMRQAFAQRELSRVGVCAQLASHQSVLSGSPLMQQRKSSNARSGARGLVVYAVKDGATLDRPLRVAVVGGGPAGACTAETLAKGGIETYMFERKMDNCKASTLACLKCRL